MKKNGLGNFNAVASVRDFIFAGGPGELGGQALI
jgi:hypothetical protein